MPTEDEPAWALAIAHHSDYVELQLTGDLDLETAPYLLAAVDAEIDVNLVIDLSRLEFIDSSGLSALIRVNKRQSAAGRTLRITPPAPRVAKAFEITGLDQILPLNP